MTLLGSRPARIDGVDPRFRVEFTPQSTYVDFVVYDLADHGPDLPYAKGSAPTLDEAIRVAMHYVVVAA